MPAIVSAGTAVRRIVIVLALLAAAAASAEPWQTDSRISDESKLQLHRLESVERRIDNAERQGDRWLVVGALMMFLLAFLLTGIWRAYLRMHGERLHSSVRGARQLMRDVRAELERPQLAHLRAGYQVRKMMRRLRDGATLAESDMKMLADCRTDGDLPAALYMAVRALQAELQNDWHSAVEWLNGLCDSGMQADVDVLLHLAYAHNKLAAVSEDVPSRQRHLELSEKYYARFAVVLPPDYRQMPLPPKPQLPPKVQAESPPPPLAQSYQAAPQVIFADGDQIAAMLADKKSRIIKLIRKGYAMLINYLRGNPLPLMPILPVVPPPDVAGAGLRMWDEMATGNRQMAVAAAALSVRARNRHFAVAINHYARAQAHHTNETLCHNWGLALLAKALHLPRSKRQMTFRRAADMFAAGNAVRAHYFDFSLAVLYALADDGEQCRKWLQQSAASATLDVQSLSDPVFDNVRGQSWFAGFAG